MALTKSLKKDALKSAISIAKEAGGAGKTPDAIANIIQKSYDQIVKILEKIETEGE